MTALMQKYLGQCPEILNLEFSAPAAEDFALCFWQIQRPGSHTGSAHGPSRSLRTRSFSDGLRVVADHQPFGRLRSMRSIIEESPRYNQEVYCARRRALALEDY